jgi:hypothetical protein
MFQSRVKFTEPTEAQASSDEPAGGAAVLGRGAPAGRVVHDARGTAIWDWGGSMGGIGATTATGVLRMLDDPMLEMEGERALEGEWAGDPYNRGLGPR